jgi:hypothetical protein
VSSSELSGRGGAGAAAAAAADATSSAWPLRRVGGWLQPQGSATTILAHQARAAAGADGAGCNIIASTV